MVLILYGSDNFKKDHTMIIRKIIFMALVIAPIIFAEETLYQDSDFFQPGWCGFCKITDNGVNRGGITVGNYRGTEWKVAVDNCQAKGGTLWPALYSCAQ